MALPVFQAAGTHASGTGNVTVNWPTHQAGDIALLFVESANESIALGTANGFVEVPNSPQGTGTAAGTTATRLAVFWCRATSSSMASPVITDPGNHAEGVILTFRGCVAEGNPWNITSGGVKATTSTSVSITGVTTTVNDCLIVAAAAHQIDTVSGTGQFSGWADASLSNITERFDNSTNSGNGGGIGVITGELASAGASGTVTATIAATSVNGFVTIALHGPATKSSTDGVKIGEGGQLDVVFNLPAEGLELSDSASNALGAGGGSTYGDTGADGLELSDDSTPVLTLVTSDLDGVDVSDSATDVLTLATTDADGLVESDDASVLLTIVPSDSDGVTLSDIATATVIPASVTYPETGADGIKVGEGGQLGVKFKLPYEGFDVGDSASATVVPAGSTYPKSAIDGLRVADAATSALGSGGGTTYGETGTEGLKLSDVGSNEVLEGPSVDGLKVSDTASTTTIGNGPYDSIKLADAAISSLGSNTRSGDDGVTIGEGGTLVQKFKVPTEQVRISDSATSNVRTGTIVVTASDGIKFFDLVQETEQSTERVYLQDDTRLTIVSDIPDEGLKVSDSATAAVPNVINSGTEGVKVSDTSGLALTVSGPYDSVKLSDDASAVLGGITTYQDAGTDGIKLSDSATVTVRGPSGAIKLLGSDGIKVSDVSGVAISGVQSPEGMLVSDQAFGQISGAAVWQEVGVDVVKIADAAGTATTVGGPYDSVVLTDVATCRVRQRVTAVDGTRVSDSAFGGDEQFLGEGVVLSDTAYPNIVVGDGCLTPSPTVYDCISDPSAAQTTEVNSTPVIFTEVDV